MKRSELKPGDRFRYVGADGKPGTEVYQVPTPPVEGVGPVAGVRWSWYDGSHPVQLVTPTADSVPAALPKPDMVNAPAHYTALDPQPIEVVERWGLDFFLGSALKYIARAPYKGKMVEDLEKAVSFLQRKILSLKGKPVVVRQ